MRSGNIGPVGPRKMVLVIGCMALLMESGSYAGSVATPVKMVLNEEDRPWEDSYPYDLHFASVGGLIFYVNWDKSTGGELWTCDGTPGGARMVKDIAPGMASSSPDYLVAMGDKVYFSADDGQHGAELWRSDGTAEGTVLIADICAGAESSSPMYLTVAGGTVYFAASNGQNGRELWKSDGTATGTVMVRDIWPGPDSSAPEKLAAAGSTLFFLADDGIHGLEIWKSDGTAAGTELVRDLVPGPGGLGYMGDFTTAGSLLFFAYDDGVHGWELWKSDGTTSGTAMVRDLYPGVYGSSPHELTAVGSTLFFTGISAGSLSGLGYECGLWRSDGTASGTLLVMPLYVIIDQTYEKAVSLTAMNSTLYFIIENGPWGEPFSTQALWKSDGTTTGTVLVKADPYRADGGWNNDMTAVGSSLFFTGKSVIVYVSGTIDLWRSDGTATGTIIVAQPSVFGPISPLGITGDSQVYFAARQENLLESDVQLWRSDGATSGTYPVGQIRSALDLAWHPENPVDMMGVLYFATDPSGDGGELWRSDGTPGGTSLVHGSFSLLSYGLGLVPICAGNNLYFAVVDEKQRTSIWRSDGTSSGTVMLKDFGTSDWLLSQNLVPLGSIVVFPANDGVSGSEPWKTDGTPAGTTIVKDIVPGSSGSYPWNFTTVGSHTFFTADDEIHGRELWKTDGSASGTVMVRDITPGASSTDFQYFKYNATVVGDLIYFKNGRELWRSDGTTSGTFMLRHSLPYFLGMHDLTKIGSMVYFSDDRQLEDQSYVDELWRTDGTTSGTIKVKEFHPSPLSSYSFGPPVPAGSFFYFLLGGWNNPVELWKSDGSEAGTVRIKSDLGVEMISCPITVIGSCAFFTVSTASAGTELWMSDGTPEGTAMLKDIWPGSRSSRPREAVAMGSTLYFLADEPVNGCNLWKSDGTEAGTVPVRYVPQGPYTRCHWAPYPVPESSSIFFFRDWLGWPNALWRYGETRAGAEPGWAGYR